MLPTNGSTVNMKNSKTLVQKKNSSALGKADKRFTTTVDKRDKVGDNSGKKKKGKHVIVNNDFFD